MLRGAIPFVAVTALLLAAIPHQAFAYIDPGAGSYMLQLLLAGAISTLFAVKVFWGRIKAFFRGESDKEEDN